MVRLLSNSRSVYIALILLSALSVSVTAWRRNNVTFSIAETEPVVSFWELDIFHLPPDVAFPGAGWLQRIATDETVYTHGGKVYSSAYAALLNDDPLSVPCRNFNVYINSIVLPNFVAAQVIDWCGGNLEWAHYALCYMRNFIGAMLVYYGTAGVFHYFCYVHPTTSTAFAQNHRPRPSAATIWHQIKLAQLSLFVYVLLPVVDEFLVEQNWTWTYFTVQEIGGWAYYLLYAVLYFALVEVGIYWMHRKLHTNKWLYRNVHLMHHAYNKPETLTPWASIAFHPLDGILQASPYVAALFVVPCHYPTHFMLLFFTAVWATYIHDAMDFNIDPIMGSKYHTVHHTHYVYNYGQVFTFCDRIFGTLRIPTEPTGGKKQILKKVN
jgi:lathosterol oxidase